MAAAEGGGEEGTAWRAGAGGAGGCGVVVVVVAGLATVDGQGLPEVAWVAPLDPGRAVVVDVEEAVVLVEQPAVVVGAPGLWGAVVVVGWEVPEPLAAPEPLWAPAPGVVTGWVVVVLADWLPVPRFDPRSWPRGSNRLEVGDGAAVGEPDAAGGLAPAACTGPPRETAPARPTSVSPAAPAVRARRLALARALSTMAGQASALVGRRVGRSAKNVDFVAIGALPFPSGPVGLGQAGMAVVGNQVARLVS